VTTAVITVVSGRHEHLLRQHQALVSSHATPDLYIVVAMDDPWVTQWAPTDEPAPQILSVPLHDGALPLATARNVGADAAIAAGADLLVFLDVDCIPSPEMVNRYTVASAQYSGALLCGPVGYLPENTDYDQPAEFGSVAHFHSFRPRPQPGEIDVGKHELFWSLSFAVSAQTWRTIGGFHEQYRGYGAEDTDFAVTAQRAGVEVVWVGGADAFHQYHPTTSPPVQHLTDILRNGSLFASRWGYWPMQGWLDAFEQRELVTWDQHSDTYVRTEKVL
jgi:hypothetical protein